MARLSLYEIRQSQLSSLPIVDGRLIVCTDTGAFYRDLDGERIVLGASIEKVGSLPLAPLENKVYLLLSDQQLWYYTTEWIQLSNKRLVVQVQDEANLPSVGSEGLIYIVKQINKMFRWDGDDLSYHCVGSDYNDIKVINGGTA